MSGEYIDIDLLGLGNRKIDYWDYEEECRFKLAPFKEVMSKVFMKGGGRSDL